MKTMLAVTVRVTMKIVVIFVNKSERLQINNHELM